MTPLKGTPQTLRGWVNATIRAWVTWLRAEMELARHASGRASW